MSDRQGDSDSEVIVRTRSKTQKPKMYKVILHNDRFTTMEFVVDILEDIFHHPPAVATQLMLRIHREGQGVAGVYTKDVADTKVQQVEDRALEYGFPLLCTMEQA
ncbi:MAG: ATP-dependent Clp protease adapter ClpS [Myxococcota bacterium]